MQVSGLRNSLTGIGNAQIVSRTKRRSDCFDMCAVQNCRLFISSASREGGIDEKGNSTAFLAAYHIKLAQGLTPLMTPSLDVEANLVNTSESSSLF